MFLSHTASIRLPATNLVFPVQQYYHCMVFVHHLTHAQMLTWPSTSLELNSTLRTTPTYVRYLNLSSPVALGSLSIYHLSKPANKFCLDAAVPVQTLTWLFDQIFDHLILVCIANCKIIELWQYAAPAATIQSFVSGAIGFHLPSYQQWTEAYSKDKECKMLFALVRNLGKICKDSLKDVHYCYRQPQHNSHIVIEDNVLIFCKPFWGSSLYTRLQIVPANLQNIHFVAFHTNSIGGHFNAYRTLHHLCLQYHWPEIYTYIKQMCSACPGCTLGVVHAWVGHWITSLTLP